MKNIYYNSANHLCFNKVDLSSTVATYPTPFYIYSTEEIRSNCEDVLSFAGSLDFLPCYALKANYNPSLLKIIKDMNFGADVVSGGELFFALESKIPPEKIVFAGVGKSKDEIHLAISKGIHSINIESESELNQVTRVATKLQKKIVIAVRVNPDIDANTHPYISTGLHSNKFGVTRDMALQLYKHAAQNPYVDPSGIHVHIGSQIETIDPYLETVNFLKTLISQLEDEGIPIKYIDLGGGIGIDYEHQLNENNNPNTYIKKILPGLLKPFKDEKRRILMELGRSIIGTAGLLITKILYIKKTPHKKFIIVDAAMNNLIRPSLYGAYHQILPLNQSDNSAEDVDIVGPICETSDFFAKDRRLPLLNEGDYLAITGAGAYGQALSSNYNLRPMIAEYLIEDIHVQKIFKGESIDTIASKYKL
jgi:diaminopimelate decarboxylase